MDPASTRFIRVAPATVIIFSVLLSPALIVGALLIWRGQQIPEALGLCVVYIAFVYLICSPSVELTPNRLIYRSFLKRKAIALSEVVEVKMGALVAPTIQLFRKSSPGVPFSFIVKPFSKLGVVTMLHHIRTFCPEARFDRITDDMSVGDFRSITRETISSQNLMRFALILGSSIITTAVVRAMLHQ